MSVASCTHRLLSSPETRPVSVIRIAGLLAGKIFGDAEMMKYTNMKRTGWLLCIAVLLAGCSPSKTSKTIHPDVEASFGDNFIVEEVAYRSTVVHGMKDGKLMFSLTLVFPDGQHYYPAIRHVDGDIEGQIYSEDKRSTINAWYYGEEKTNPATHGGRKIADVSFHHVYFLDGDKIVFQKSNEELGIDMFGTTNLIDESKKLRPILENLIRENVQPREPEMESLPPSSQ